MDSNEVKDCGELVFTYNPGSEIKVDVNLITYSGQVIAGRPLHLGLTYGEYTIEYVYWRGNSPKTGDRVELGKISTEIVNGEEVPIKTTLNADRQKTKLTIPNWNE